MVALFPGCRGNESMSIIDLFMLEVLNTWTFPDSIDH